MKLAAVAVVAFALFPSLSRAAPPAPRAGRVPPLAAARPAKRQVPLQLQVARAVFPRARWEKLVRDASSELTERIVVSAQGQYEVAPEFGDRLREEYEKLAPYEELVGYQARILGHEYTRVELKQLLRFYRSPLGQRSVLVVLDLMQVSHLQMQSKVRAGMEAALGRLVPLVRPVEGAGAGTADAEEGAAHDGAAEVPDLSAAEAEEKLL